MATLWQDDDDESQAWMAQINTTPLVDVMLVLLIIFLLTIPAVTASLQVRLPVQTAPAQDRSGDYVIVSVDAWGHLFLNGTPIASAQVLVDVLTPTMSRVPPPQLHLQADAAAPYAAVAVVMDAAQRLGLAGVVMLTQPQLPSASSSIDAQPVATDRLEGRP